ncbi:MAG: hypothetical protein NXI00_20050 [Cytophagales bacterium]|nr:hypothetical protein [Cytophagales bacterium]
MKRIVVLLSLILFTALGASAQRAVTVDTLQGAETVNFGTMENAKLIQALCTQTGGTSDGSLILQVSLDGTAWTTISETSGIAHFEPNDTLTITNGATYAIWIDKPFPYARIQGAGTSGDSTRVAIKYSK